MTENDRVVRYRDWRLLLEKYPHDYRIHHVVTDESFAPSLECRDLLTGFWLTIEQMEKWRFDLCAY